MYVIFEEEHHGTNYSCHGLFVQREKAIVEKNFLEWQSRDSGERYVIVDVGEVRDADSKGWRGRISRWKTRLWILK